MARQRFANNVTMLLSADLDAAATSCTVDDASVLPVLNPGEYFLLTITDGTSHEIVKATAVSGNTLTIERGQESTTVRSWTSGDSVVLPLTAAGADNMLQVSWLPDASWADPFRLGDVYLWPDAEGWLRVKYGAAPTSDGDGEKVTSAADGGLKFDGTDESVELQKLIDTDIQTGVTYRVITSPPGAALGLGRKVNITATDPARPYILDLRPCSAIRLLQPDAGIRSLGKRSEWPTSNLYRLASDAPANSTTIDIDASPQGGDMSRLTVGTRIILRGEQDANGDVLTNQYHETTITNVSNTVLTLADPLPAEFKVSYPNSAWGSATNSTDYTLITIVEEWALNTDASVGDRTLTLATDPTGYLSVGDWLEVRDDTTAGDIQGSSTLSVNVELHRVAAVSGTVVTLDRELRRAFTTTKNGRITKLAPSYNVAILCSADTSFTVAPGSEVAPAWELKHSINSILVGPTLDDTRTTYTTNGPVARVEGCYGCRVTEPRRWGKTDSSDATSGYRYGVTVVESTACTVEGGEFVRCRHGVVVNNSNTSIDIRNVRTADCLVSGLDTHGANNIGTRFIECHVESGPSRAPDASNQSGLTIGNTSHQAGDVDIFVANCTFDGFSDPDGAIEIRTPCKNIIVTNCKAKNGDDAITLKETGTIDGGTIHVDAMTVENCTGYVIDDDTTSTKFSRVSIGTVLTDGNEAGLHSVGASGQAVRPDLVPDKGTVTTLRKQVTTTPYSTVAADRYLHKSNTSYDVQVTVLEIGSPDSTARTVNLHADAAVNDEVVLAVPDGQTGTVTVGLQSGATFQDGSTTWQVVPAFGNGVERQATFTCVANSDGSSAVWVASGDLVPPNGYYTLDYPLVGAFGRIAVAGFTTSFTLATSHEGKILEFTGTAAVTVTLPSTWSGTMGVWPLFNRGSADVTIAGGTSGSVVVPAGEAATIVRSSDRWYVMPAGAFTEAT